MRLLGFTGFYWILPSCTEFSFRFFLCRPQKERTGVKTTYAQNTRSMLKYEYDSVFFVCRKP